MPLHPQPPAAPAATSEAPPGEKLLSRGEAARYLGLPVTTVYQWARSGRLRYKVTLGGHLRFSRADLDSAVVRGSRLGSRDKPTD